MSQLIALVLATPIWGFALTPPVAAVPDVVATRALLSVSADGPLLDPLADDPAHVASREDALEWTRGLQIATTIALAGSVVLGSIQFGDQYGFHGQLRDTSCARGTPAMSHVCGEPYPLPRTIVSGVASGLSIATMVMARFVVSGPPSRADELSGRADRWRTYEVTRLIGVGLTMAQALLGFVISNAPRFGWLDQSADFETMQGLAISHQALGITALGLSVANSMLLF